MRLKNTLEIAAKNAHNRRLNQYHIQTGNDPTHPDQPNPLMGHCVENTRETSWELACREIPHRIVRGAIAYDAVALYGHWLMDTNHDHPENTLPDNYDNIVTKYTNDETGEVTPDIWDVIDKPTTSDELPDEASHYWIEVNGEETQRFDTLKTFVVDTAAEARKHYGEPHVYETHPTRFYLKTPDSYTQPWQRLSDWEWNPRDPNPY